MNPEPASDPPEDDAAFIASLRQLTLRQPPADCRRAILAATAVAPPVRWYRSPFWRSMAALWAVLLGLWLNTPRTTPVPADPSAGFSSSTSLLSSDGIQSALVSLERPSHPHSFIYP